MVEISGSGSGQSMTEFCEPSLWPHKWHRGNNLDDINGYANYLQRSVHFTGKLWEQLACLMCVSGTQWVIFSLPVCCEQNEERNFPAKPCRTALQVCQEGPELLSLFLPRLSIALQAGHHGSGRVRAQLLPPDCRSGHSRPWLGLSGFHLGPCLF